MFVIQNSLQNRSTLRCVWVPAHMGPNAPLTAVWIVADSASVPVTAVETEQQGTALAAEESDPWCIAA